MLPRLAITLGDTFEPLEKGAAGAAARLVEARIEMELSKATRFALRFEDEICESDSEILEGFRDHFGSDSLVGLFTTTEEPIAATECLVLGRVTRVRSSFGVGGTGSWVELHGEDRRAEMAKVAIDKKYEMAADAAVKEVLGIYGFKVETQPTLIEHDKQKAQLVQNGTDLAFVEDQARRNNMEFWFDYVVTGTTADGAPEGVDVTANFMTSPRRTQGGPAPVIPVLSGDADYTLRLHPDSAHCKPNITKFDARVDFDKPTSAHGFAMKDGDERAAIEQAQEQATPVDPKKDALLARILGTRKVVAPAQATETETKLAVDRIVNEQSWFVEADCSASTTVLGFVVRPHMVVPVEGVGDALSGSYQVMTATHVFTTTDQLVDFTLRANGFQGGSDA